MQKYYEKCNQFLPNPFSTIDVILKNDSKIRKKGGPWMLKPEPMDETNAPNVAKSTLVANIVIT